ncbi:mRNA-degrading endonuclease RelE of RelBE toxin-antitoxin system [Anoxybacillus voinovskiensis]|uniref:mRNA-degrading endonuclease RelE of RelBE toxin-antitoxin system n=1 Tax=Anoxybacteroides voinovskiense TaxID=230470 RepID=A0A840DXE3_9BACL|nr:mRNA-degrading endonuclease RelE of RelBE toxin-antitoxin system [Anoxybacillus voinovskiensis]
MIYRKEAVKFLAKQEKVAQERIALGLQGLLDVPPQGDIKKMKGQQGLYRLRIGTYRILFRLDHQERIIYPENTQIPKCVNLKYSTKRYFHPSDGAEFFRHGRLY